MSKKSVAAIDLGAESGRVMRVDFDGTSLQMEEIHRFPNIPVQVHNTLHWDILRLWQEITDGLSTLTSEISSIGVDTWGVDFALLDRNKNLLGNPVHYRDTRTEGMMEWVFERIPKREVFERTGIQFIILNGLYQFASLVRDKSPQLEIAETFLSMPDLFNFWLTGNITSEFTDATTMQFYNPITNDWDRDLLAKLGLPTDIYPQIVQPGTQVGKYHNVPVIAPASHDTGSAVVAVPTQNPHYAYISSGTWSLMGLELDRPIITDESFEANVTNEGGAYNTFRFLKNIAGMWIIQQCRKTWEENGASYQYNELAQLAKNAKPFQSIIDPDYPAFFTPGDMPQRIEEYCKQTEQELPESVAQMTRTVYESLALKYRYVLDQQIRVTGHPVETIHIIGGGSKNTLLCQMTANATGRVVVAGPVEATALGNAIVQFISLGEFKDIQEARSLIRQSPDLLTYEPQNIEQWETHYQTKKHLFT